MKAINLKEIKKIIITAIILIFAFIYIKEIWHFITYIIKIFMPFIVGLAIAFVINVLMNTIEKKWLKKWNVKINTKRIISLVLSILLVLSFIVFLLLLIIPNLQNTIALFADSIPIYSQNIENILNNWQIDSNIVAEIDEILNSLGTNLTEYIKNNSNQVLETTLGIASNVVTGFVNTIIGFVFAIYFLAQKERISNQFKKLMQAYLTQKL